MVTTSKEHYPGGFLARLGGLALAAATAIGLTAGMASAAGSVQWNSPADGTVFDVGTEVMPDGTAFGFGTGGTGLDLALVLDASGSMNNNETVGAVTQSRLAWQAEAAVALVNSLPTSNTAVAVVRFASSPSVLLSLTPTTSATDIVNAINGIAATGLTATGAGIVAAENELNTNGTAGRSKQMVVISDGNSNTGVNPVTAATNANANSGIIVHGVAIPGDSTAQMQAVATAGGGSFINATTPQGLQDLIDLFSGFGGSLVGVSQVDITMPDGTVLPNVSTDAFGNFKTPGWNMLLGDNLFQVTATFDDQSQASANLNLIGVNPIPLPAAGWLLLSGLAGLGVARRMRRKS